LSPNAGVELKSRSLKGTSFGRTTGTPFGRLNQSRADSESSSEWHYLWYFVWCKF